MRSSVLALARYAASDKARHPRESGDQYAAAFRLNNGRLWNTGSPAYAGDDS